MEGLALLVNKLPYLSKKKQKIQKKPGIKKSIFC